MLPPWLGYITIVISLTASGFYIRDMLRGKTKPNRVSWFIWAVAPLIGAGVEFAHGAGARVIPTFMSGFSPIIIFTFALFVKSAYWKIEKFDIVCGILSLIAIYFWLVLGQGTLAVVFAVLADAFAAVPTLRKAWRYPETETSLSYLMYTSNAVISILIARSFSISALLFPIYFFFMNAAAAFAINRRKLFPARANPAGE